MALIPEEIIAQVRERSDIVEVISSYLPLKKAGRNYKALSPFTSEKTPSFFVSPEKQIFHCFSTNTGGNVISFVMKQENLSFPEAVRFLAKRAGIIIPETKSDDPGSRLREKLFDVNRMALEFYHHRLLSDKSDQARSGRDYLKKRGVDLETVNLFQIGLAGESWDELYRHLTDRDVPESVMTEAGLVRARERGTGYYDQFRNRVIFPILDARGQCRAFGGRALDDHPAKYLNSPETKIYTKGRHLFGLHAARSAIADEGCVVVVEGYMDAIMPFRHGYRAITASLGTALTREQITLLRRYTDKVVLLFDMDTAGQNATLRSGHLLIEEEMDVRVARMSEGEDPDTFIRAAGVGAFREEINKAVPFIAFQCARLQERFGDDNLESKQKIVREILPTIRLYKSEVLRGGYLDMAADHLDIPRHAIRKEFERQQLNTTSFRPSEQEPPAEQHIVNGLEEQLLKLGLLKEELLPFILGQLDPEDLQDQRVREIFGILNQQRQQGETFQTVRLFEDVKDADARQMISRLLLDPEDLIGDPARLAQDYLAKIKSKKDKIRRQELLRAIQQAEINGNQERLHRLREQFNLLVKNKTMSG